MKIYLLKAALVYTVFVVYGSLVPLEYSAIPLSTALQRFEGISYLNLGIGSRADWVANILLFIPLAFLWMGVFVGKSSFSRKVIISICVGLFCGILCVSIEFIQLYFPQRTVSINDIIAECIGAIVGISIWWLAGDKFIAWINGWFLDNSKKESIDHYLQIYLAGLFLYNVIPLDLVISPVEIYHKWNEGRIILIPFSGLKEVLAENLYEWGSEIALWIPVPILWQRKMIAVSPYQLWIRVFLAAFTIEFLQVFVYSRVTDLTDIILALVGGGIGIWLTRFVSVSQYNQQQRPLLTRYSDKPSSSIVIGGISYIIWCCVLMLVFWYPFDFKWNRNQIGLQLDGFFRVPFYAYYYSTEFRAITEVFHKVLFFIPLGVILAFIIRNIKYRPIFFWGTLVLIICTASMIEVFQVFLPEKIISSTDLLLQIIGGVLGFNLGRNLFNLRTYNFNNRKKHKVVQRKSIRYERRVLRKTLSKGTKNSRNIMLNNNGMGMWRSWMILFGGVLLTTFGLLFSSQFPAIPYNLRELISGDYEFLRCFGLSVALFWCFGFPVWFLNHSIRIKMNALVCIASGVFLHSFFAWFLIRIAVPLESIYDVVGFPVLDVPQEIEIFFRFFSLFSIFSLALFGSVLATFSAIGLSSRLGLYFILGFICVILFLPFGYWIVVVNAATDNLTELLRDEGHSFLIIGIFIYMFLFGNAGSMLSAALAFHRLRIFLWAIGFFFLSFSLGFVLLNMATEQMIFKYGKVFSAMQFLLSSDRSNYVSESELFVRFCFANFFLVGLISFVQFFLWSAGSTMNRKASNHAPNS